MIKIITASVLLQNTHENSQIFIFFIIICRILNFFTQNHVCTMRMHIKYQIDNANSMQHTSFASLIDRFDAQHSNCARCKSVSTHKNIAHLASNIETHH